MRSPSFINIITKSLLTQPTHSAHSLHRTKVRPSRSETARKRSVVMIFKKSKVEDVEWLREPVLVRGNVHRGMGRGSRDLGTPTANLPGTLVEGVSAVERDGVYVGFGRVPSFGGAVVKMVANLGRNITYDDVEKRVLEAYLMSDIFHRDFYDEEMRLCIIGFVRPEWKFASVDELIEHINNDVTVASKALDLEKAKAFRDHPFLTS